MNRLLLRLAAGGVVLLLGSAAALAQTTTPPAATDTKSDPVVAVVNGKTLKRSDVVASAQTLPPQYRNQIDQLFPQLVNRLIDITLMVDEGRRQKLQNNAMKPT